MQFSLFEPKLIDPLKNREKWGYNTAPPGTKVKLSHMPGMNWYLVWLDCPDEENILAGWQTKKEPLISLAAIRGWEITQ